MNSHSNQDATDFAMELMNEVEIPDDVDFTSDDADITQYFDGTFEDSLDAEDFSFVFDENPHEQTHQMNSASLVSSDDALLETQGCNNADASAFYDTREYVDNTNEGFEDPVNSCDDMSISSDTPSAAEQKSPAELDAEIQESMSKLVQSMHRSEISRNMLGRQQQSMGIFGIGSFLNGYSQLASGITQSKSQLNNYISQVGNSSMM